ncbi:reverse transcriptase N-terminal domain-containing protein [Raoultella terrigena]|uniref:reverse transcriptase N-terminal domain-containing protein n=1 Tax=Raoultella terrigena TaxID=577 RepID=UPI001048198C
MSGEFLATRRVTRNKGRNTPGVDSIIWDSPPGDLQGSFPSNPEATPQLLAVADPAYLGNPAINVKSHLTGYKYRHTFNLLT